MRDELVVTAAAVEDAVASDLEEDHRVVVANARITEFGDTPALEVTMTIRDDVAFQELRRDYETLNLETLARSRRREHTIEGHLRLFWSN